MSFARETGRVRATMSLFESCLVGGFRVIIMVGVVMVVDGGVLGWLG